MTLCGFEVAIIIILGSENSSCTFSRLGVLCVMKNHPNFGLIPEAFYSNEREKLQEKKYI